MGKYGGKSKRREEKKEGQKKNIWDEMKERRKEGREREGKKDTNKINQEYKWCLKKGNN